MRVGWVKDSRISRFDRVGRLHVEMRVSPGWTICESPIGPLTVVGGPNGITNVHFSGRSPRLPAARRRPLREAVDQLQAYFAAERQTFELDLDLRGTHLQTEVWRQLLEIPYGTTTTYGEVAERIDGSVYGPDLEPYERPRVVGAAIGSNPVPIVVACHRVIGADGSLTGYLGGLRRKQLLLDLESGTAAAGASVPDPANHQLPML
jgi:methylated-DNA-[protein]-cysteine S-methyltransferase